MMSKVYFLCCSYRRSVNRGCFGDGIWYRPYGRMHNHVQKNAEKERCSASMFLLFISIFLILVNSKKYLSWLN